MHRRVGLDFLSALLPPAVRRGQVLVDPAYEVKDECNRPSATLSRAIRKQSEGIYPVWHPVLRAGRHDVEWPKKTAN